MNYPSVSSNPVHDFSPGYDSNPGGTTPSFTITGIQVAYIN